MAITQARPTFAPSGLDALPPAEMARHAETVGESTGPAGSTIGA